VSLTLQGCLTRVVVGVAASLWACVRGHRRDGSRGCMRHSGNTADAVPGLTQRSQRTTESPVLGTRPRQNRKTAAAQARRMRLEHCACRSRIVLPPV